VKDDAQREFFENRQIIFSELQAASAAIDGAFCHFSMPNTFRGRMPRDQKKHCFSSVKRVLRPFACGMRDDFASGNQILVAS